MLKSEYALLEMKKYAVVGGIDEVGKGPFAGPVVAACVVFDRETLETLPGDLHLVNDSKKLSESMRRYLSDLICQHALQVSIGVGRVDEINDRGADAATGFAMYRAWVSCDPRPDILLIDGRDEPPIDVPMRMMVKGDGREFIIAAASVVAKHWRDSVMIEVHKRYPEYGLKNNKGYGTPQHIDSLKEHGYVPGLHRPYYFRRRKGIRPRKDTVMDWKGMF